MSSSNCSSVGAVLYRGLTAWLILFSALLSTYSTAVAATPQDIEFDPLVQLPVLPPGEKQNKGPSGKPRPTQGEHDFTLRHIFHHGTYTHPDFHARLDVTPDTPIWASSEGSPRERPRALRARSRIVSIERLQDRRPSVVEPLLTATRWSGKVSALSPSAWTVDDVPGPNVTDKETILNLARMASNAYETDPGSSKWEDITYDGFNLSNSFGWEGDGLRGHIFADSTNSTIIMGLKGTTTAVFDGAGTTTNDKVNDNLFFSCCCAQGGQYFWKQVCDCRTTTYTCNQTCIVKALRDENRYYRASLDLYANVTALYPKSEIWLTGHSLGGSVSSLLGLTYGLPVVTYEAPPQALAATRLGLPTPPGSDPGAPQNRKLTGVYHIGHTADPIFMGVCNGVTSVCSIGGYAMETVCHSGYRCVYDVVADKGWRSGVGTHRIASVINDVIKAYDTVAECELEEGCIDCYNWKYFESNGSTSTSSSSTSTSTSIRTRTSTCQTPGWWGCLDETTTSSAISSSSDITSTSSTTTTCRSYGWFGHCLDPTSTSTHTTRPAPTITTTSVATLSSTSTSSCKHPGFFGGCDDPTPTATSDLSSTGPSICHTPGLFWGCYDQPTISHSHSMTAPPTTTNIATPLPSSTSCTSKAWFGLICIDSSPDARNVPTSTITVNRDIL